LGNFLLAPAAHQLSLSPEQRQNVLSQQQQQQQQQQPVLGLVGKVAAGKYAVDLYGDGGCPPPPLLDPTYAKPAESPPPAVAAGAWAGKSTHAEPGAVIARAGEDTAATATFAPSAGEEVPYYTSPVALRDCAADESLTDYTMPDANQPQLYDNQQSPQQQQHPQRRNLESAPSPILARNLESAPSPILAVADGTAVSMSMAEPPPWVCESSSQALVFPHAVPIDPVYAGSALPAVVTPAPRGAPTSHLQPLSTSDMGLGAVSGSAPMPGGSDSGSGDSHVSAPPPFLVQTPEAQYDKVDHPQHIHESSL
jgi:hypothetical protein